MAGGNQSGTLFSPSMASSLIGQPGRWTRCDAPAEETKVVVAPQMPSSVTDVFIRKTGSDNNGGSSASTTPDRTGGDGVANGTTTFTAASGSFASADVGKLINILTKGRYRIVGFTNSTTVTLSGSPSAGSSLTWNLGGAVLTIGAILTNTNGILVGGDRVWVGAGTYRETITIASTLRESPNNGVPITITGDVDGVNTGDAGLVRCTSFTSDVLSISTSGTLITIASVSSAWVKGLTWNRLLFETDTGAIVSTAAATSGHRMAFYDCVFISRASTMLDFSAGSGPMQVSIERCVFLGYASASVLSVGSTTGQSTDFDNVVTMRNCLVIVPSNASSVGIIASAGSGSVKPGNVITEGCTGQGIGINFNNVSSSTGMPARVRNCVIAGNNSFNGSGPANSILEDYNAVLHGTRTNTSIGPHSDPSADLRSVIPAVGLEIVLGMVARTSFEPLFLTSLNFGQNILSEDALGRPRQPSGPQTVGALGSSSKWARETTIVRTGSNAISCAGFGFIDFDVPVDASLTTVSVYLRRDSAYAGRLPELWIVNGSECGVPNQIGTMYSAVPDIWEQVIVSFTPTQKGIVTVRLIAWDYGQVGHTYADDFAIS